MNYLWIAIAVLLGAASLLSMARLVVGPTTLDRALAVDVLLASAIAGIGAFAAFHRDPTVLPVLLVLSLLGFVGSVSISRFVAKRQHSHEEEGTAP